MNEKLCPICKNWNSVKEVYCFRCGEELFKKERLTREVLEGQPNPFKIPFIKINDSDGYVMVFGKRLFQLVQLIFFGIISFLLWIASILPG
jgi:hypothetical protein